MEVKSNMHLWKKRVEAELVVSRQEDDIFRAITWDLSMQFLREIEGKKFDVLNVESMCLD